MTPIIMGLIQAAPMLAKWISGDDKETPIVDKAMEIAQALTGQKGKSAVDAINSDPALAFEFQKAVLDNEAELQGMAYQVTQAELGDKQNAREQHKHSRMPAVITIMLTLIVSGLLWALFFDEVPKDNISLAMMMFGQVFTLWGASITYWVGTTRSSANKDKFKAPGS